MAMRIEASASSLTDSQLANRASAGDSSAFESLYRRHADAAWRVALAVSGNAEDASDAVSEAFMRLLQGMAQGRVPPTVPFRPYLLATTRNASVDILRRHQRVRPTDIIDLTDHTTSPSPSERVLAGVDAALIARAFRSLPERWRSVLWLTEVEGMPARQVGELLGLSPNATSQLASRARHGLRERYLQAHLEGAPESECRDTVAQLGAYAAGALSPRAFAKVDQHLAGCAGCRARLREVEEVEAELRSILLPLPLLLAPAALERFHAGLTGAGHAAHSFWLGGPRTAEWSRRAYRPLASVCTGLLALGMIAAGLMDPGAPSGPVAAARPTPLSPTIVTTVSPLSSAAEVSPAAPSAAGDIGTAGTTALSSASSTSPDAGGPPSATGPVTPAPSTSASPTPGAPAPNPPASTPPAAPNPSPLVQAAVGVNAGPTAAVSVGLGPGSCTGVSVAGSPSCAGPAPAKPGVSVTVVTPLGTVATPNPAISARPTGGLLGV